MVSPGVMVDQPVAHLPGDAQHGVSRPEHAAELGGGREAQAEVGAPGRVAVVVVGVFARGVILLRVKGIVEAVAGAAAESCPPLVGLEAAPLVGEAAPGADDLRIAATGKHLDGARGGLRAEQRALRPSDHLDSVYVTAGEMAQIELTARIVDGYPIHQ